MGLADGCEQGGGWESAGSRERGCPLRPSLFLGSRKEMVKMEKSRGWEGEKPLVAPDHYPPVQLSFLLPRKAESCAFNCAQQVQHLPWVTSRQQPPLVKETSSPFGWSLDRFQIPAIWWRVAGRLHQDESFLQGRPAASKIDLPSRFAMTLGTPLRKDFFPSIVCHHWGSLGPEQKGS